MQVELLNVYNALMVRWVLAAKTNVNIVLQDFSQTMNRTDVSRALMATIIKISVAYVNSVPSTLIQYRIKAYF